MKREASNPLRKPAASSSEVFAAAGNVWCQINPRVHSTDYILHFPSKRIPALWGEFSDRFCVRQKTSSGGKFSGWYKWHAYFDSVHGHKKRATRILLIIQWSVQNTRFGMFLDIDLIYRNNIQRIRKVPRKHGIEDIGWQIATFLGRFSSPLFRRAFTNWGGVERITSVVILQGPMTTGSNSTRGSMVLKIGFGKGNIWSGSRMCQCFFLDEPPFNSPSNILLADLCGHHTRLIPRSLVPDWTLYYSSFATKKKASTRNPRRVRNFWRRHNQISFPVTFSSNSKSHLLPLRCSHD